MSCSTRTLRRQSPNLVPAALPMAHPRPDTHGSQLFIVTAQDCSWLDGKHTVFGTVSDGLDVVDRIEAVDTDAGDRPREPAGIETLVCDD